MALNNIISFASGSLLPMKQDNNKPIPVQFPVTYEQVDSSHYKFEYSINENLKFDYTETDSSFDRNEFRDSRFDKSIDEKEWPYYAAAAASGLLCGGLGLFPISKEDLDRINEWKEREWNTNIVSLLNFVSIQVTNYNGAVSALKKRAIEYIDQDQIDPKNNALLKEVFNNLASNPSYAGLIFSLLSQFSGKHYSFSENNTIESKPLPSNYPVGKDNAEKIIYAILCWVFYLCLDEIVSHRHVIEELNAPKELKGIILDLSDLPFFQNIPTNYAEAEELFFNKITDFFTNNEIGDTIRKTLNKNLLNPLGILSLLINECLIRSFYIIRKFYLYLNENEITALSQLKEINPLEILPFNNRISANMSLISSASYFAVSLGGSLVRTLKKKKHKDITFLDFICEVDIAGLGRLVFAIGEDAKYWNENIQIIFSKLKNKKQEYEDDVEADYDVPVDFVPIDLSPEFIQILHNLEYALTLDDINLTKKSEEADLKREWLATWKTQLSTMIGIDEEAYFSEDTEPVYDYLYTASKDKSKIGQFYLLALELSLFSPYSQLGGNDDSLYKKLKSSTKYYQNVFGVKQNILGQNDLSTLQKEFDTYKGLIDGSTSKSIIGASATAAVVIAVGGVALTFAPGIAIAIAGQAVAGLHGAALTSASLAFIGGGSLAAGGLGMAGGTAIITGSGAMLGLISSGAASAVAVLNSTPKSVLVDSFTKTITYLSEAKKHGFESSDYIADYLKEITLTIHKTESELRSLNEEENDLDKDLIKQTKEKLIILENFKKEITKLLDQK